MEKVFNKLVRDKIPQIIEDNGEYTLTKKLNKDELELALNRKLKEEVNEVINASNKEEITEELADLLEVIYAKAKTNNISLEEIEAFRIKKQDEKGAFNNGIFLIKTVDEKYIDDNRGCLTCVTGSCTVPYDEKTGLESDGKPSGYYCISYKSCYSKSK